MATVTKPIALDESLNTTEQSSRNIADVLAQEIGNLVTVVSRIAPPTTVSWNQIEQSGTKIAEITINGTKTDVYAPQGGGGFSALIIVTDALAGVTITATKGGVTKTGTSIGNNQYEISVDSSGTWTISDGTNTATVTVTAQTTYYLTLGVPDGSTVTPTDDIQTLLNCANIWDKSYTTLTELLADSTSLQAVISSNNAIDYLVRSTSFAKANALVPIMTSDNTPSGECFGLSYYSGYPYYHAFDGNNSTDWYSNGTSVGEYIGYKFDSPTVIKKAVGVVNIAWGKYKVQASNDNVSWADLTSELTPQSNNINAILNNSTPYLYYRLIVAERGTSGVDPSTVYTAKGVQFYSENGFTDNSTAMSYIGLNNYASNTLLGDSTWCSAICNSTYFESVLNVKVPTMTSNNTPSGVCSASSIYNAQTPAWNAFDGNDSSSWTPVYNEAESYIEYDFPSAIKFVMADFEKVTRDYSASTTLITKTFNIEGFNDSTFTQLGSTVFEGKTSTSASSDDVSRKVINTIISTYSKCRISAQNMNTLSSGKYDAFSFYKLQFYGRADV